ncbi:MAG: hypothetical protein ACREMA_11010 [Longimicrobiales bacterium]
MKLEIAEHQEKRAAKEVAAMQQRIANAPLVAELMTPPHQKSKR